MSFPEMEIWLDAQFSYRTLPALKELGDYDVRTLRDLQVPENDDLRIFHSAKQRGQGVVILTKDSDFADLLDIYGSPPAVILVLVGNVSNRDLLEVLRRKLPDALAEVERGASLVYLG